MVHYKITMFYKKSLAQAGLASEEATKRINIIEKAMVSFIFNFHSQDKRVMSSRWKIHVKTIATSSDFITL